MEPEQRCASPCVIILLSQSTQSGLGWPFDTRLLWNVLTLLVIIVYLETRMLPDSINTKKVAPLAKRAPAQTAESSV